MDSLRCNNFYLDIRGIRNLKHPQIYDFVADQLQLTPLDVQAIQVDLTEGKDYVKLSNQQQLQEIVEKFDDQKEIICDGKSHKVRIYVEDGGIDVKLHHLPPRMPEDWIRYHMQRFGNIISISNEKCKSSRFPDTLSGVRIVRMQLRRAIPSYISIRGYSTYVTYNDQVQTCRHCSNVMHRGRGCAENRAFLAEQEREIRSYADIAAGKDSPTTNTSSRATIVSSTAPTTTSNTITSANTKLPGNNTSQIVNTPSNRTENTLRSGPETRTTSNVHKASEVSATGTAGLKSSSRETPASRVLDSRSAKRVIIEADISEDDEEMAEDEISMETRNRTVTRAQASSREASRTKTTK